MTSVIGFCLPVITLASEIGGASGSAAVVRVTSVIVSGAYIAVLISFTRMVLVTRATLMWANQDAVAVGRLSTLVCQAVKKRLRMSTPIRPRTARVVV